MIEIFKTIDGRLKQIKNPVEGSWISLISPTEEELARLKKIITIPDEIFISLSDIEEVPDAEKYRDFIFILVRTPQKNPKWSELEYSTVPLGIIISRKYLITICFYENDIIEKMKRSKIYTSKKIQTTLKLLLVSAKTYLNYLKNINKRIYSRQKNLEKHMKNEGLIKLLNIQKSLVYFSTSLKSNQILIEKLTKNKVFTKFHQDKELLEDVMEETRQAIQMTNVYWNILNEMTEAFGSIISNNVNMVMKLLTSITIILMLPTLVASIYGMNIPLPFQHSPHAFEIVMGMSIILSIVGVLIFWRKELF